MNVEGHAIRARARSWIRGIGGVGLAGLIVTLAAGARPAAAQTQAPCDLAGPAPVFPHIPICAFVGAYQDSSLLLPKRCLGTFTGPLPDSVVARPRTVTVRFRRDRRVEARQDFGGYRVYRVIDTPDSSRMVLIRRFSRQTGDERLWNFSAVTTQYNSDSTVTTLPFICHGTVANDSVVTFVDPDSSGAFVKVCRLRKPQTGLDGLCISPGDSVLVLKAPPGPHDGFRTWYAITYEGRNNSLDGNYADLFVPDTLRCANPSDPNGCPNLNHKLLNLAGPVEPTGGPQLNLRKVVVVPNPFRSREAWDAPGGHELHFINLPQDARIRIYTVAGDLVADLQHHDPVHDFESWDLRNGHGADVASGIYMYRVEAASFSFQDRFIVIR